MHSGFGARLQHPFLLAWGRTSTGTPASSAANDAASAWSAGLFASPVFNACAMIRASEPPITTHTSHLGGRYSALSNRLCSFPVSVRGKLLRNSILRGHLIDDSLDRQNSNKTSRNASDASVLGISCTTAWTASPKSSWGMPITAASRTAGWFNKASSVSCG